MQSALDGCENRGWSPEHFAPSLVDGGALESASAMITDVFKYRADRERYYHAAGETANIVKILTGRVNLLISSQFYLPQRAPSDMMVHCHTKVRS